jgi:hypothetical protein
MPLESVYKKLSVRLPPLYEQLILNYRWADVDLQHFCLHTNPLGEGFTGLFKRISKDAHLWKQLVCCRIHSIWEGH